MKLLASDVYQYFCPEKCELRIHLLHTGRKPDPPGPYQEVLRRLGERHEFRHFQSWPRPVNLRLVPTAEERILRTRAALAESREILYQPLFAARLDLAGLDCELRGEPDFLLPVEGGHAIRDVKIARQARKHPEIVQQLQLYGWLYAQTQGRPAARLEVWNGRGELEEIPYDQGREALATLENIVRWRQSALEPYSPVGWSKCLACGYRSYCWPRAEKKQDVALVYGVDQGLARALQTRGVNTIPELLARFQQEKDLAEVKTGSEARRSRVGQKAASILLHARAMLTGRETRLGAPRLPAAENYAVFDLEGLPPQLDELEKIYLWGLQVFGAKPTAYLAAAADFGSDGDRSGWLAFLEAARQIFQDHGDIPFLVWHHYEERHLKSYRERYGDPQGVAERVLRNLCDLHRITREALVLPLSSYSLKVVERHVAFQRRLKEGRGDWSMAKYIEAVETEDPRARAEVMSEIKQYNQEDLAATWAVFRWLQTQS